MALEQHGIARRTPQVPRFGWKGGTDAGALRADLEALRQAQEALRRQIDDMEDRIVRRLNEMLLSGTLAQRPAAGVADRIYWATDQASGSRLSFDTGSAWVNP